jgi:hypothetical protein
MRNRRILLALAAALLACSFGTINAMAGTVPVFEDAGTFSFVLSAPKGGGSFTIDYSNALLSTINFAAIPTGSIDALLPPAAPHTVTSATTVGSNTFYTITQPAPNIKEFGVGPGAILTASLEYELNTGVAVNPGFLNLSGLITAVPGPFLQTMATGSTIYDFSAYASGAEITRTYTAVGANFAAVIANGGTITGTGAFADLALVPEPTSMALLGIGVSCMIAARRYFRQRSVV